MAQPQPIGQDDGAFKPEAAAAPVLAAPGGATPTPIGHDDGGFKPDRAAAPDLAGTPAGGLTQGKMLVGRAVQNLLKTFDDISGHLPGIDYAQGTSFGDQVALDRSDNDTERYTYLTNKYGEDNVFQDPGSRFYVVGKDGKRTVAGIGRGDTEAAAAATKAGNVWSRPRSALDAITGRIGADVAANALPLAGGIAGAALAPETGGLSMLLAGAAGAGGGSFAGKGLDELLKWGQGFFRKTPKEEIGELNTAAAFGAGGQAGGEILTGIGRTLRGGYSPLVKQPTKDLVADALRRGMVPNIAAAVPPSKILKWEQTLTQTIWGNPAERGNVAALKNELKFKLVQAGFTDAEADAEIQHVINQSVETHLEGKGLLDATRGRVTAAQAAIDSHAAAASKDLDATLARIDKTIAGNVAGLDERVAADIEAARTKFSTDSSTLYGEVDKIVGGQPVVPTVGIKKTAQRILDDLPKTAPTTDPATGTVIPGRPIFADQTELAALHNLAALPDKITFVDAQRIRSQIFKSGLARDLTPGVEKRELNALAGSVDAAFDAAATQSPLAARATPALRAADAFYKDGIEKFKDLNVNRLVREAGQRGAVEPEAVVNTIIKPGNLDATKRIWQFLSPQTRRDVASADWKDLVQQATRRSDGKVDGMALLRQLQARGKQLDFVHGAATAQDMREYARGLGALFEGADPQIVETANLRNLLVNMKAKQAALDGFMKDNYLAELAKPGKNGDEALDYILREGKADRLLRAREFYGEGSTEWQGIRRKAMSRLLESAIGSGDDPLKTMFAGPGLKTALERFRPRQLEILFGPETSKDLYQLSDTIQFMTQKGPGRFAGGLAAGQIMFHPFGHLWALGESAAFNQLFSRPGFIKWLSLGLNGDTVAQRRVAAMVRSAMAMSAQASKPDSRPPIPPVQ